jgi:hypothetical protein
MGVDYVNLVLAQLSGKAPELNGEIAIVEAREGIGRDLDLEAVDLITQDASWIKACDLDIVIARSWSRRVSWMA